MAERTEYAPGTFCWADLATTDTLGAVAFYSGLFGWEPHEVPDSDGYTLMRMEGADVCAIHAAPPGTRALPAWRSWVSVEDAAATAARAAELGGAVVREVADVTGLGRSAVLADPQGAVVGVWQPGAFAGAALVNEVGAMVLNQLNTHDPEAAGVFYADLFGWEVSMVVAEPAPYWGVTNGGRLNGGVMRLEPPAPPHWLVYFTSEDLDGSDALIVDMGGAVVVPPMDVPGGRVLVAHDPGYAFFALLEGRVDP